MKPTLALLKQQTAAQFLALLVNPVLFINIEPEFGERYQGIVPLDQVTLAGCLMQYYDLSAQIPTRIVLASTDKRSGGLLIQLYHVMMKKSKTWSMKIYGHV